MHSAGRFATENWAHVIQKPVANMFSYGKPLENPLHFFQKVALMIVFIGAGFASSGGSAAHFSGGLSLSPVLNGKFAVSLIFITFAYSGWNAAAYLGGEVNLTILPTRHVQPLYFHCCIHPALSQP